MRVRSTTRSVFAVLDSSSVWSASCGVVTGADSGAAAKFRALAGESTISIAHPLPRLDPGAKAGCAVSATDLPRGAESAKQFAHEAGPQRPRAGRAPDRVRHP